MVNQCAMVDGCARVGVQGRMVGLVHARMAGAGGAGRGPTAGGTPSHHAGCDGAAETNCETSHSPAHLFLMNA